MLSPRLITASSRIQNEGMLSLFDNLSLWWDFNESSGNRTDLVSGTTATDSGGVTRVSGPSINLPYAAQFSTTGSKHLSIPDNLDTRVGASGSMTIMLWVNTPSPNTFDFLGKGSFDYLVDSTGGTVFRFYLGNRNIVYSAVTPAPNTWFCIFAGINQATNKLFMQINGAGEELSTAAVTLRTISATPLYFGRSVNNRYLNGSIAGVGIWKKYLSIEERAYLYNSGSGRNYPFGNLITAKPEIITPVPFQVQQTSGSNGAISIVGAVRHLRSDVEASFNNGTYTTLATGVKGLFSSTDLINQPNGQGILSLRAKASTNVTTKSFVGLGDIFIVAGQSNASGRSTNNQAYSHASLKATMFGNDYFWADMSDPIDRNTNQVDTVSSDSAAGSIWPLVATSYLSSRAAPCAFVPCARGGTTSTQWLPGVNHQDRTTLYGSMVYRALQTGAKAIFWWQGEQDAFNAVSTATYQANMGTIISALATDLPGVKFMPAKLHKGNTYSDGNAANIQTAIQNIWNAGLPNVVAGPDLSDLRSESGDHFLNNTNTGIVANRWWSALQSAFSW